jgi:hypothetical protein
MTMTERQIGTHIGHCCARHGCKYRNEDCPVEKGTHEQTQACESCTSSATLEARIKSLQKELAWSKGLEAKGFRIHGYDEDYYIHEDED